MLGFFMIGDGASSFIAFPYPGLQALIIVAPIVQTKLYPTVLDFLVDKDVLQLTITAMSQLKRTVVEGLSH